MFNIFKKKTTDSKHQLALIAEMRNVLVDWRSTMDSRHRPIANSVIADVDNYTHGDTDGAQNLNEVFGMSRASFAVVPRVMARDMPNAWQAKFAECLEELALTFPNQPDELQTLTVRSINPLTGRMRKIPDAACNYRHPDFVALQRWKRQPIMDREQFKDAVAQCVVEAHFPVALRLSTFFTTTVSEHVDEWLRAVNEPDDNMTWRDAEQVAIVIIEKAKLT